MTRSAHSALCMLTAFFLSSCSMTPREQSIAPGDHPVWAEAARAAARDYTAWKRVSDRANWAPTLCRAPFATGAQFSRSTSPDTHGRKLYFLFAKMPNDYPGFGYRPEPASTRVGEARQLLDVPTRHEKEPPLFLQEPQGGDTRTQPIGQTLVKESFTPAHATHDEALAAMTPQDYKESRQLPPTFTATGSGDSIEYWRVDQPAGLFIMFKVDPVESPTTNGWVYATTDPAGRLSAVGPIASCIECHRTAKHDGLFGLPWVQDGDFFTPSKPK